MNSIIFLFRILTQTQLAMATMQQFGFKNKDIDEIKAIFDTNHYLLLISIIVAFVHVRQKLLIFTLIVLKFSLIILLL